MSLLGASSAFLGNGLQVNTVRAGLATTVYVTRDTEKTIEAVYTLGVRDDMQITTLFNIKKNMRVTDMMRFYDINVINLRSMTVGDGGRPFSFDTFASLIEIVTSQDLLATHWALDIPRKFTQFAHFVECVNMIMGNIGLIGELPTTYDALLPNIKVVAESTIKPRSPFTLAAKMDDDMATQRMERANAVTYNEIKQFQHPFPQWQNVDGRRNYKCGNVPWARTEEMLYHVSSLIAADILKSHTQIIDHFSQYDIGPFHFDAMQTQTLYEQPNTRIPVYFGMDVNPELYYMTQQLARLASMRARSEITLLLAREREGLRQQEYIAALQVRTTVTSDTTKFGNNIDNASTAEMYTLAIGSHINPNLMTVIIPIQKSSFRFPELVNTVIAQSIFTVHTVSRQSRLDINNSLAWFLLTYYGTAQVLPAPFNLLDDVTRWYANVDRLTQLFTNGVHLLTPAAVNFLHAYFNHVPPRMLNGNSRVSTGIEVCWSGGYEENQVPVMHQWDAFKQTINQLNSNMTQPYVTDADIQRITASLREKLRLITELLNGATKTVISANITAVSAFIQLLINGVGNIGEYFVNFKSNSAKLMMLPMCDHVLREEHTNRRVILNWDLMKSMNVIIFGDPLSEFTGYEQPHFKSDMSLQLGLPMVAGLYAYARHTFDNFADEITKKRTLELVIKAFSQLGVLSPGEFDTIMEFGEARRALIRLPVRIPRMFRFVLDSALNLSRALINDHGGLGIAPYHYVCGIPYNWRPQNGPSAHAFFSTAIEDEDVDVVYEVDRVTIRQSTFLLDRTTMRRSFYSSQLDRAFDEISSSVNAFQHMVNVNGRGNERVARPKVIRVNHPAVISYSSFEVGSTFKKPNYTMFTYEALKDRFVEDKPIPIAAESHYLNTPNPELSKTAINLSYNANGMFLAVSTRFLPVSVTSPEVYLRNFHSTVTTRESDYNIISNFTPAFRSDAS